MDFEAIMFWTGLVLMVLEFLGRVIPDVRITGPLGFLIRGLKLLVVLVKDVSEYVNRESEDQKAMKKSRFI